jgi:hypothetical protein
MIHDVVFLVFPPCCIARMARLFSARWSRNPTLRDLSEDLPSYLQACWKLSTRPAGEHGGANKNCWGRCPLVILSPFIILWIPGMPYPFLLRTSFIYPCACSVGFFILTQSRPRDPKFHGVHTLSLVKHSHSIKIFFLVTHLFRLPYFLTNHPTSPSKPAMDRESWEFNWFGSQTWLGNHPQMALIQVSEIL